MKLYNKINKQSKTKIIKKINKQVLFNDKSNFFKIKKFI